MVGVRLCVLYPVVISWSVWEVFGVGWVGKK